ncbi:c6 transcription factor [Stemphylium lycopersici]|uniref:C6 transcription factor n=1 Tax=Stemphylium lycopersici TaxID=183478 RepID=A0A364N0N7_STELY|nr:c6 transcription factor [Stemphylium lycopersici]
MAGPLGQNRVKTHVFAQVEEPAIPPHSKDLLDTCIHDALLGHYSSSIRSQYGNVLKHFTTHTIPSFAPGAASQSAWRKTLPDLACKHSFVTNAMLAAGFLHLSHLATTKEIRNSYQNTAAIQMNAGMAQYRLEVQHVTTENSEALFAFSTILTIFVLSTAATECALNLEIMRTEDYNRTHRVELMSNAVHTICRVFRSMRGVLVILIPCWDHLRSGPLQVIVQREWWPAAIPVTEEEISNDKKLLRLEKMWSRPGRAYDYSFDHLRIALKSLRETFALTSRLECLALTSAEDEVRYFDWTSVIHWPVQLTPDFLSLLEQQHVEAWVLIAHFAMLPPKAKGILWLDGLSMNIVTTAALVIGEENWNWIAWPVQAIGVDLKLLRNSVITPPHTSSAPKAGLPLPAVQQHIT